MPTRLFLIPIILLLLVNSSCGGGDKHLPPLNPPEYGPKKVYTTPTAPPSSPRASPTKPAEPDQSPIELPSLEPGPNEKGDWKRVPVNPESLQLLKGVTSPCEALSKIVQGLGSAQVFAGAEGQALKKSLGSQAESLARSLDQQLFDTFKQQLGLGATDCPSPALPGKSSFDDSLHPPRLMLATGPSHGSFELAQATVPGEEREGYRVTKGSVNIDIPPDSVGKKTREWRVEEGNRPNTAVNRNYFTLVNGGYAKKCPTAEGDVEGDYELSLVVHQTINDSGTERTVYNARRIHAKLKGHVDDDAKLQYVDLDATLGIGRGGTDLPTLFSRQRQHVLFVPDRRAAGLPSQFSNWSVMEWNSELVGATESDSMSMLLLAVTLFSGPIYLAAEGQWTTSNTCVEIQFTPASKQRSAGPNQSVQVKAELRTKKDTAVVPAKFKEAKEKPNEGNGRVTPREVDSSPGAPATFTYTSPPRRVRHSGFEVGAISRAGVADSKWELGESYVLEFRSRIVSTSQVDPAQSQASAIIRLDAQHEGTSGAEPKYTGQGVVAYLTGPLPNWNACDPLVRGQGTIPLRVFQAFIHVDPPQGDANASQG
ncbi:MAG TPA: hypothetical protein VK901_17905, partial [Nitrospiraceae bacterium]|nr:hypothetical protein [Nitrospiraceae bacterium]